MVRVEERWSCRQDALRRVYLCGDHCEDFARDPKTSNQLNESFPMSPHTPPNSHRESDYTLGPSGWGPLTLAGAATQETARVCGRESIQLLPPFT